ncbi:SsgA family sporulation/cell division regulator [Frankia sp. CNm7]|uniref:SsgA family sporulation/cell division regulator n=1 Tax=Frankia nepalensis TaxID=1836974 RepID=A0A937RK89_9ACTN|nr:SsgA family sporulation/cell division regulator [Frankia nepalensis]MBL7495317.1 SsgA family sporulation/cell division regulator [Frankia nepalensis]MBL7509696.1 SsgA family sporulation/cell division regulator [Frankia nepalensis]MBL7517631.1 SsgA family sporulation/cell division regulator [Frankia nepalensis]MBL7631850.1 SsgA family sporulation/cell division regulator [Frankia nepalensis]
MTRAESVITVPFDARLLDDGGKFSAELRYRRVDPFAVVIRFDIGGGAEVEWVFARELLEDGLRRPAGLADVRVAPIKHAGEGVIELTLSSPGGHARIGLPGWAVRLFLRRVTTAVPPGTEAEHIDWDLELSLLAQRPVTGDGPSVTG